MIRVGLLGASRIAPKAMIAPVAARDDITVTALACRDAARGRDYARTHDLGEIAVLDNYAALCQREDIDLIYNALPPSLHAEFSILAAQHGKAVLCEKPFALNAEEARTMVAAADSAGTILMEAFHYRYHPAFQALEDIVHSGRLGEIERVSGVFDVHILNHASELRYDPTMGGGALMDLGCYPLHAMRTLTGHEPKVIESVHEWHASGVAVASWAMLDFGGVEGTLACNMDRDAPYDNSLQIIGTDGVALLRDFVHPYRWGPQTGFQLYVEVGGQREVTSLLNSPEDWKRTTFDFQLDHLVEAMRHGGEVLTGGADAIANMAAIDAIMAAGNPETL